VPEPFLHFGRYDGKGGSSSGRGCIVGEMEVSSVCWKVVEVYVCEGAPKRGAGRRRDGCWEWVERAHTIELTDGGRGTVVAMRRTILEVVENVEKIENDFTFVIDGSGKATERLLAARALGQASGGRRLLMDNARL